MSDTQPDTGTDTTATDETTQDDTGTDTDPAAALQAELDKWKALSKKHEDRAKANAAAAKELETFRKASMTEQEQAVEAAREEGRRQAMQEASAGRVEDALRAAAAGRLDADALIENVDRTRFLTEDGQPDREAIAAWVDRIAPKDDGTPKVPDLGQGTRPSQTTALNSDALVQTLKQKLGVG